MLSMSLDGELAALRSLLQQIPNTALSTTHELKRTEETIDSLNALLERIEKDFASESSIFKNNEALEQQLGVLITLCHVSITKLNEALGQSSNPEADVTSNIAQLQNELLVRYSDLEDFVGKAGIKEDMARADDGASDSHDQEALILEAVDKILTDGSMPKETSPTTSGPTDTHNAAWRHLLVKLRLSGFQSSDVERHKTSIFHRLSESLHIHHRSTSNGATAHIEAGQQRPRVVIPESREHSHAPVQPPVMSYIEHLARGSKNSSKYKRPTASTIADDSDDDARSVGSDASTLLGAIDDRNLSEHYTFSSPASSSPIIQGATPNAGLRSPLVSNEKIVTSTSNPRGIPIRPAQNTTYPVLTTPPQRDKGSMARPSSPRERDPRYSQQYFPAPRHLSSVSMNAARTSDTLVGRRTHRVPNWMYRRPDDLHPPLQRPWINVQDYALPEAAADGRNADVERFLQNGFNIESYGSRSESRDQYRTTALFRAASQGHFRTVHLLLRYGANPNQSRSDGKPLVRILAERGEVEMLRLLLEYNADLRRLGALPEAAMSGHYNVVQLLLDYDADVNEMSTQTALYHAASTGGRQIAELLLQEGADTELTASEHTALCKAVKHEHETSVRVLLQYGASLTVRIGKYADTMLHVASDLGNEGIVRELLLRGASPNEPNGRPGRALEAPRRYPLHFSARKGHFTTARALIEYRANPNALTEDGRGPVDIAIENGHDDLVDLLTRAGGYPQQSVYDRGMGYRIQDMDSPRGSHESQVRRFSTSVPERPRNERRTSGLAAARSFENDTRRRDRSANGSRRSDKDSSQRPSSKSGTAAAMGLIGSAALMMIGG